MNGVSLERHSIFLGPSGSGKTELSVNCALRAAQRSGRRVCFFDMDQTKGLFRSRDLFSLMAGHGIETVDPCGFQDAPVVPAGVLGKLDDQGVLCVFDVGGSAAGSVAMGQYADRLRRTGCDYYFVVNPCRPFMDTPENLAQIMAEVVQSSGAPLSQIRVLSNPNMGPATTAELVLAQHKRLESMLGEYGLSPAALCAAEELVPRLSVDLPVIPLRLYLRRFY